MTNRRLFGLCGCLLALCLLVWPGLGQECDWEYIVEDNQTFHPDPSSVLLTRVVPVQYVEDCQKKCCAEAACHLAVLGFPQDGGPQCMMYNCQDLHRDVCVLHPNDQLKIYRKKVQAQPAELKKKLHVVQFIEQSWKRESNETNYVRCRLPKETGPCRASFQKFYYDVVNETCKSFIYGGCAGNDNNFDNKEECDAACRGVTGSVLPDVSTAAPKAANRPPAQVTASHPGMPADEFAERCEAEPEVGPCRASFMRWYYDSKTRTCQSFIFGGCQGNMNNYENMESCIDACTVKVVLPSQKSLTKEEYDEYCTADSDPGPCRAAFHMFYYNRKTGTCQSFIYGGCRGNLNRYSTAEECFTRCSNEGSFSGHNKSRSHWTAAFFLFSILAAISALLLAALIFIALRRKLNRRPSSVSDKEELLPDPDEHSSVESLSVQESPGVDKA